MGSCSVFDHSGVMPKIASNHHNFATTDEGLNLMFAETLSKDVLSQKFHANQKINKNKKGHRFSIKRLNLVKYQIQTDSSC